MDWIYFPIGDLPAEESDTRTPGARNGVRDGSQCPLGAGRGCRTRQVPRWQGATMQNWPLRSDWISAVLNRMQMRLEAGE